MSELIDVPPGCAASVTMTLTRVVARTTSPFTLEEQAFQWPGERWSVEFNPPAFTRRATASPWLAFAIKTKGSFNYFLLGDPAARNPQGIATGNPLVAAGNQVGNVLQTKGWTPSVSGILRAGDYIQYGTGINSRLHMVVEDANSDALGNANLTIEPALRYSPLINSPVVVNDPKGVFRMSSNSFSWSVAPGPVYRLNISAEEVVNA